MNCPKCNAELPEKFKFCPECGSSVSGISSESAQEPQDVSLGDMRTLQGPPRLDDGDAPDVSLGDLRTMQGPSSSRPSSPDPLSSSSLADRYELGEEIGRGGFARVWKARDKKLDRIVAVKRLLDDKLEGPMGRQTIERFEREATAIAQLNHRNVVMVYDHDTDDDGHYVVMEYVEGGTLRDYLKAKGGKLPVPEAIELVKGIAQGLGYAHRKNLVHRDIKPANILLDTSDTSSSASSASPRESIPNPKIVDFGLARIGSESELSMSGYGMGTPWYMPPEQRRNAKGVNHTADIYALGKVLYELISGETPDNVDPEKIPEPRLVPIILKCIKSNPEERYFSCEDLVKDIGTSVSLQVAYQAPNPGKRVSCSSCGTLNPEDGRFCEGCGVGMTQVCPECGRENSVKKQFCRQCGTEMSAFSTVARSIEKADQYYLDGKFSRAEDELSVAQTKGFKPRGKKGEAFLVLLRERRSIISAAREIEQRAKAERENILDSAAAAIECSDWRSAAEHMGEMGLLSPPSYPPIPKQGGGPLRAVRALFSSEVARAKTGVKVQGDFDAPFRERMENLRRELEEKWAAETKKAMIEQIEKRNLPAARELAAQIKVLPLDKASKYQLETALEELVRTEAVRVAKSDLALAIAARSLKSIHSAALRVLEFEPNNEEARQRHEEAKKELRRVEQVQRGQDLMGKHLYAEAAAAFEGAMSLAGGDFPVESGNDSRLCSGLLAEANEKKARVTENAALLTEALGRGEWRKIPALHEELSRLQPNHPLLAQVEAARAKRRRRKTAAGVVVGAVAVATMAVMLPVLRERVQRERDLAQFEAALAAASWGDAAMFADRLGVSHPPAARWMNERRQNEIARERFNASRQQAEESRRHGLPARLWEDAARAEGVALKAETAGEWVTATHAWNEGADHFAAEEAQLRLQAASEHREGFSRWREAIASLSPEDRVLLDEQGDGLWQQARAMADAAEASDDPFRATALYRDAVQALAIALEQIRASEREAEERRTEMERQRAQAHEAAAEKLRASLQSAAEIVARARTAGPDDTVAMRREIGSALASLQREFGDARDRGFTGEEIHRMEVIRREMAEVLDRLITPAEALLALLNRMKAGVVDSDMLEELRLAGHPRWTEDIRAGIIVVYALGCYVSQDLQRGDAAARVLLGSRPESVYAALLDLSRYRVVCLDCEGSGVVATVMACQYCHGSRVCNLCQGRGWNFGIGRHGREQRSCGICRGSGQCSRCAAGTSGAIQANCASCGGAGYALSPSRIRQGFNQGASRLAADVRAWQREMERP